MALSATAVALFMGNITSPSNDNYYEDDSAFHQITSGLSSGWSFSSNKAEAFACETDDQHCEHVTVYGDSDGGMQIPSDVYHQDNPGGDVDPEDGGSGDDGGGTATTEADAKEICQISAQGGYETCINTGNHIANTLFNSCKVESEIINLPWKLYQIDVDMAEALLECQQEKDDYLYRANGICIENKTSDLLTCV